VRLPRALRALAHEAVVTEDGLTLRSRWNQRRNRIPESSSAAVPLAAIHSGHGQSRADNHEQPRSSLDLRRSLQPQVTILPDLALGARGRSRAFDASIYLQVAPFQSRSVVPPDVCNEL
jgi:hypothetical protein